MPRAPIRHPHRCPHCPRTFPTAVGLKRHVSQLHAETLQNDLDAVRIADKITLRQQLATQAEQAAAAFVDFTVNGWGADSDNNAGNTGDEDHFRADGEGGHYSDDDDNPIHPANQRTGRKRTDRHATRQERIRREIVADAGTAYHADGTPAAPGDETPPLPLNNILKTNPFYPLENLSEWEQVRFIFPADAAPLSIPRTEQYLNSIHSSGGFTRFTSRNDIDQCIADIPGAETGWSSVTMSHPRRNEAAFKVDAKAYEMEEHTLYLRDIVAVVKDMLANPDFRGQMCYSPYTEHTANNHRIYQEMGSADWWHELQAQLPKHATVVPLICGSDKALLSVMKGNLSAWPVYLKIGNIEGELSAQSHRHALIPIGYLPVPKCSDIATRSSEHYREYTRDLFHRCMRVIFEPLRRVGQGGIFTQCSDGWYRKIFPILAAWIADYPEQCLLSGILYGRCFRCRCKRDHLYSSYRDPQPLRKTRDRIAFENQTKKVRKAAGFHEVKPFTEDLPFSNIYDMLTTDILHQLVKGEFQTHLVEWTCQIVEEAGFTAVLDQRIKATPAFPNTRSWKDGLTFTKWTGRDSSDLMKIWLPVLHGLVSDDVLQCLSAFIQFAYYARFTVHTEETLHAMDDHMNTFYELLPIAFSDVRDHFDIPKIHSMQHYSSIIRRFGSANHFNSELTERCHISFVRTAYRSGNRTGKVELQMLKKITRDEALRKKEVFLQQVNVIPRESRHARGRRDRTWDSEQQQGVLLQANPIENGPTTIAQLLKNKETDLRFRSLGAQIDRYIYATSISAADRQNLPLWTRGQMPPSIEADIRQYNGVTSQFYQDFDLEQSGPLLISRIRATPSFFNKPRYDCIIANVSNSRGEIREADDNGLDGYRVGRVLGFYRIYNYHAGQKENIAYVEWFEKVGNLANRVTGNWKVRRQDYDAAGQQSASVIPIKDIVRGVMLIPVYLPAMWDRALTDSVMDIFNEFWVVSTSDADAFKTIY